MLQLKQRSFEINDKVKNLFLHLTLDTATIDYGFIFDRIFLGEEVRIMKQPWAGKVDMNKKRFKIIRTKADFLKTDFSSVIIKGAEKKDGDKRQIEVSYGISWKQTVVFILSAMTLIFVARSYFSEAFTLASLLTILVLHIFFVTIELRKTANLFDQYLNYTFIHPMVPEKGDICDETYY